MMHFKNDFCGVLKLSICHPSPRLLFHSLGQIHEFFFSLLVPPYPPIYYGIEVKSGTWQNKTRHGKIVEGEGKVRFNVPGIIESWKGNPGRKAGENPIQLSHSIPYHKWNNFTNSNNSKLQLSQLNPPRNSTNQCEYGRRYQPRHEMDGSARLENVRQHKVLGK